MPEESMMTEGSSPEQQRREAKPRETGRHVVHTAKWHQRAAALVLLCIEHGITATLRFNWADVSSFVTQEKIEPAIYCLWHNRLALCMAIKRRVAKAADGRLAAMVSASKDGAFLSAVLEGFDVQPVRGSSSRRGPQALLELQTWADKGYNLALTPDGPRGPRYNVREGVIVLAQITGLPIIPLGNRTHWKWTANSWDKFQIPLPFSKCEVIFGEPIRVPREVSDEQREQLRQRLEKTMKIINID
jgi:hypothetical protein